MESDIMPAVAVVPGVRLGAGLSMLRIVDVNAIRWRPGPMVNVSFFRPSRSSRFVHVEVQK
jgi:hypothetical protein